MVMQSQSNEQPKQKSQTKPWSDAELRRVARAFELLIRVDKRLKKGKSNDNQNSKSKP